ncbi:hypothetical protein IVA95_28250 [Bradyrhizobium sp. 157]|uniref:hypothetical protein n=1 Tax=Bradyrhizobium sp. 157 TaxID=2782631 RepID=UPI001FF9A3E0|nr:hypothetical protein [Bradyrhizobium sp. 157]MCK1641354.1 hypothetical protein [Bradyrhizobium sp. 157]
MRLVTGIEVPRIIGVAVFWEECRLPHAGHSIRGGATIRSQRWPWLRKLTELCRHLLTKREDYLWARLALVANKSRAMQLQAGHPQQKGSSRGPAYAYNITVLRDREILIAAQAEQSYERFVWQ